MMIFLTALATIFIAEMGDKTQLLLVAMAGKYKIPHILTGTWLATAVLNLLAVGLGAALGSYLDMRLIKAAAAILLVGVTAVFVLFCLMTIIKRRNAARDEAIPK